MGLSMRNSIETDLKKIKNVSLLIGKHAPEDTFKSYLEDIKSKIDVAWVIAPESNNELLETKRILKDKSWIGCENNAIDLSSNKTSTKEKLLEFNILNPDSKYYKNLLLNEFIVKPEDGAGCENTTKYNSIDKALEAKTILESDGKRVIVERFIPGQSMSFSMLCSHQKAEVISINRQLIKIHKNGNFLYHGIQRANNKIDRDLKVKISKIADKIRLAIPGLKGFVGVDFIIDDKKNICVIEINPRVTCAYVGLSDYLQRPIAEEILKICLEKKMVR